MKKLLLLFVLFTQFCFSQVNTELLRDLSKEDKLCLSGTFLSENKTGNENKSEYVLGSRIDYRKYNSYIFATQFYHFDKSDNVLNTKSSYTHIRYTYKVSDKYYFETYTQTNNDRPTHLKNRYLFGVGGRRYMCGDSTYEFYTGLSYMYEYEQMDDNKIFRKGRMSQYGTVFCNIDDKISLYETVYYQPNMSDGKDYRILNDLKLSIKVLKFLSFNTVLHIHYDNQPKYVVKNTDVAINNSLEIIINF